VLERRGLLIADPEYPSPDWVPDSSLDHLQAASVSYRIALGPQAGRKALTLCSIPPLEEAPHKPLLARLAGFSLHGATVLCEAWQRSRLERLCRYITRPPIAIRRLSVDSQGRIWTPPCSRGISIQISDAYVCSAFRWRRYLPALNACSLR